MHDSASETKLIIPGLAPIYRCLAPYSYALMRFSTGAVLIPHGVQKVLFVPPSQFAGNIAAHGFPAPLLLAYMTYFIELVAAACLSLGLFTRLAALMMWGEMLLIIFVFNWQFGYFWTNRGVEYALLWLLLCTAILFRGGGRFSLDRLIGWEF
jgi:putative oxidoreductase